MKDKKKTTQKNQSLNLNLCVITDNDFIPLPLGQDEECILGQTQGGLSKYLQSFSEGCR